MPAAAPILVDSEGNPVAPTSAATGPNGGVLVDENGMPLTHADVARFPGDPISQIEARKRNPAAQRVAHVAESRGGALDYAGAVASGLAGLVPGLSLEDPVTQQMHLIESGMREASDIERVSGSGVTRAARYGAMMVPVIGPALSRTLGPAQAYESGRAPTHEENVAAVEGATTAAATIALPAVARRVGNVIRARGGVPLETAPKPEAAAAPADTALSEAQLDRLAQQARPGNPARNQVPAKLQRDLTGGKVSGDVESLRTYLDANPDVAAEVKAGYAVPAAPEPPGATNAPDGTETAAAPGQPEAPPTARAAPVSAPEGEIPPTQGPGILREWKEGVAPASASPQAAETAGLIREAEAKITNASTMERYANREVTKQFDRADDETNIANISTYEKTGQFAAAPEGYSAKYKESMDWAHQARQRVYGEDRVGYVENYVRRAFEFGSDADAEKGSAVLSNLIGSLSADTSPLKGRVLDMPLDEALQAMRAQGIKVKPATTNPELLRQWSVENAKQALAYKQVWDEAKQAGLVKFVPASERVPDGLVRLDDRVAQVFFPSEKGMVKAGQYFADPSVARIFNNTISKGLGGSPTFRGIRTINNAINQFQLGFSAFHLTGTAINAGISDLSLGLERLAAGDLRRGGAAIGRSVVPAASFVRDTFRGHAFIQDLLAGDPEAAQVLNERINPAGARLSVDQAYRNAAVANMQRAWREGSPIKAAGWVPLAVVEKIASPLMEFAIPRVKIAAFMDLADSQLSKLPADASPGARQKVLAAAWDSIDNRFGQLTHDNLFWNKTARDLAQVSVRSVGWNLGTIRELGGGAADLARGQATSRALYALALPVYAGLIGAAFQYLHTGKGPQQAIDYFYPKNGLTDSAGRDDRVALPTYMKDVFSYSKDPVTTVEHKGSPLVSMAADLMTNRNYIGDMVRNPEDPKSKQLQQVGSYVARTVLPLSLQQMIQTVGEGGGTQAAEQFFGFTRAPGDVRKTDEEIAAESERRRTRPRTPKTPEQQERYR